MPTLQLLASSFIKISRNLFLKVGINQNGKTLILGETDFTTGFTAQCFLFNVQLLRRYMTAENGWFLRKTADCRGWTCSDQSTKDTSLRQIDSNKLFGVFRRYTTPRKKARENVHRKVESPVTLCRYGAAVTTFSSSFARCQHLQSTLHFTHPWCNYIYTMTQINSVRQK